MCRRMRGRAVSSAMPASPKETAALISCRATLVGAEVRPGVGPVEGDVASHFLGLGEEVLGGLNGLRPLRETAWTNSTDDTV